MQALVRGDNIGVSFDGTAAVSGGAAINALGVSVHGSNRQGVWIQNHSSTDNLWIHVNQSATSAPTITSSSHFDVAKPGEGVWLGLGGGVQIWVKSSHASNTVTFTATEVV